MLDFYNMEAELSQEEVLVRDSTRQLAAKYKLTIDDDFEQGVTSSGFASAAGSLGLFGMTLPIDVGGQGANYVSYGLAAAELEAVDSALRSFMSVQSSLCMFPIHEYGTAEHKKMLPKMAKGEIIGCFGLTEPDAGSDPASMTTTAKRTQDGWLLNGAKTWITNAPIAQIAIIWAKIDDGSVRGFCVDTKSKGFIAKEIKHKFALRASITGEISLDDCLVPDSALLPGTEIGLVSALSCLTRARFGIAWGIVGAARCCYQTALEYTSQRKQFGKPLAANQLVQSKLVKLASDITMMDTLNLRLGRMMDAGVANFSHVSLAKMNGCRVARNAARVARDLLGASGISFEYPIARHMANIEAVYTYEGTDHMHQLILGKVLTGFSAFE